MSETAPPPPSPDKDPSDSGLPDKVPEVLEIDKIDELRTAQHKRVNELVHDPAIQLELDAQDKAREKAYAEFDDMIDKYLETNGVDTSDKDDPLYKEAKATLRNSSVDHIPQNIWEDGELDDKGNQVMPPMRKFVRERVKAKFEPAPDTKGADPKPDDGKKEDDPKPDEKKVETPEEKEAREAKEAKEERDKNIAELEKEIIELQEVKHKAFAARMGVSVFKPKRKKELQGEYDVAEEAYLEKLKELQQILIKEKLETLEGKSDIEKNKAISKDLEDRFSSVLKDDHDKQVAAMLEEGGFKAKILEKYANASPKQKVAMMIGLGVLIGVGGTVALGATGGFAAVLVGMGLGGAKGAKTYATVQSRIFSQKDPERLKFKVDDFGNKKPEDALDLALEKLRGESRKDIKDADRRKKVAVGLGAAAAFGGSGLVHLVDLPGGRTMFGKVGDLFSSDVEAAKPPVDAEHAWSVPQVEVKPPQMEFAPNASYLPDGAGGLAETRDILGNVPQAQVQEVWNQVIPQLQTMDNGYGRPLAYDMLNGRGFGLRMTADHQMPKEAMEAIANKYNELYGQMPPGVKMTEAVTTITESHPIPAGIDQPVITPAEVGQMANVIKMDTISYADIVKPENAAVFDKFVHVQQGLEGTDYAKALGMPPAVWLDHLQPFLVDQLNFNNGQGAAGYVDTFYKGPDGSIHFTGKEIPASVLRDMFNEVPVEIRKTLTPA